MSVPATTIWLTALPSWPEPEGPRCVIRFPIASKTGRAFSRASASPPTKNVSVPSVAPFCPPETGASRKTMPASARRPAIERAASAAIVDESITIVPFAAPCTVPFAPRWTSSTSGESGRHETTISDSAPTSAAEPQAFAPSSAQSALTFAGVRLVNASANPARARLRAIPVPIVPSPMKPTVNAMAAPC